MILYALGFGRKTLKNQPISEIMFPAYTSISIAHILWDVYLFRLIKPLSS